MWHVLVMNDDFTPMELVIDILKAVFKHDEESAKKKTLEVHNHGAAVVGQYVFEIAEQKAKILFISDIACLRSTTFPFIIGEDLRE